MSKLLRVRINLTRLRENLKADGCAWTDAEVQQWLRDANFIRSSECWLVDEADLGQLDPSEVISVEPSYGVMLDTQKMRDERKRLGLSLASAAKLAEMSSAQAWGQIENSKGHSLTLKSLNRIAEALKVPAKDLPK